MSDLGHRELLLLGEEAEQTVLRKRNLSPREFLRKVQNEAPLQNREDVGQPLGVAA